jgi:glucan phosphoethanolaminetransferase (alkaline phosphatase superfamily)
MSPEQKAKWPATATREFAVLQPVRENVMPVSENDWLRMKRVVKEIIPYSSAYQVAGSISVGVLISFVCVWISLRLSTVAVPGWAWTFDICAICCSALMSILCLLFDWRLKKHTARTVQSAVDELDDIRNKFEPTC